jgi:hypothetical protein
MPIEFRCTQCGQMLRVPDDSSGKAARCPKCQALMTVPSASSAAPIAAGSFSSPTQPFGGSMSPADPLPPPKPLSDAADAVYGAYSPNLNPYASPQGAYQLAKSTYPDLPVQAQKVSVDSVLNCAWELWKRHLGLLVGVTLTIVAISYAVAIPFGIVQFIFQQNGEDEAAAVVGFLAQLVGQLVQMYLSIGNVQIALKLARGQPAEFFDLFRGVSRFLPVLGVSILLGLVVAVGFLLLIVPGVLFLLMFWPCYYLVLDRKTGIFESFSVANTITHGNWATAFLLWVISIGIMLLGCIALCVGMLFAAPLVTMLFAVAYLMMAGQIMPQPPAAMNVPYQTSPFAKQ